MGFIYIAHNIESDKAYIGKTTVSVEDRFRCHKNASNKPKTYFHKALSSYGLDSFYITSVEISDEDLNDVEIDMIKIYKDNGLGLYNLTDGGDDPPILKGINHPFFGGLSKEHKRKMKENHWSTKGYEPWNKNKKNCFSEKTLKNMSESAKNKVVSQETRLKLSKSLKGRVPWNKGKKHSKEHIQKQIESRGIPIILIHSDGKEEYFKSSTEAERKYNFSKGNLCKVARGKAKQHKGYGCRYAN